MNIELKEITIRDLFDGYSDKADEGVVGYGGRLDIRPPFQREFVYDEKERNLVIDTVQKGFPLNVMYWAHNLSENLFEIIDGQQRTISICQYIQGDFSINGIGFHNLREDKQMEILNYKLMVYWCSGTETEKLDWFRTINIAGKVLTEQELLNAIYSGSWVTDAKRYFSKESRAPKGDRFMTGSAKRQDYLETALSWISDGKIKDYMSRHQHDQDARELWDYFCGVIDWIEKIFPVYRREMATVDWGSLHRIFKDQELDPEALECRIVALMGDEDICHKAGIYPYVLNGEEKNLNVRKFSPSQKRSAYEIQEGNCAYCKKHFALEEMEADHITPWSQGGKTELENCQMLCKEENRRKGGR